MLCYAHAIFYFQLLGQEQDTFLVHENVYLVDAADLDQARQAAIQIAKANEDLGEDGHRELNEQKAAYIFAGIRKIIEIETSPTPMSSPGVGLKLTYSEFKVDSLGQVLALASGDMVEILYRE